MYAPLYEHQTLTPPSPINRRRGAHFWGSRRSNQEPLGVRQSSVSSALAKQTSRTVFG